jgi:F0F1-type ATP synthase beta subunit
VTVDAIDKNDKTISIKGLDGAVEGVVVANPESLDQVHVGQQIVVTLIDVVGITLDKEVGSA